jgi:hypothetical protein
LGGEGGRVSRWTDSVYAPPAAAHPWTVEELYEGRNARLFSFGRRALEAALRAAGVCPGDAVLFPAFICRDLLSSAAAVGARPEFYAVAADLTPASSPSSWKPAKAVVAVDYFGFAQDLSPFEEYCARTGAALIEDNAHGLFSADAKGRMLGTRAKLGILSLRKSLALPNGAALLAEPRIKLPEQERFSELPAGTAKKTARKVAGKVGARVMGTALSAFRAARGASRGAAGIGAAGETELPGPAAPCAELERPISVGGPVEEAARRRALHAELERLLTPAGFRPLLGTPQDRCVPYAYAYRAHGARVEQGERLLRKIGLRSLTWPDLPTAVRAANPPAFYSDVRLVHFLW